MIFAGVTVALYYPQHFLYVGNFKLTELIIPLIQIIMFGMGTAMSLKDFATVFKSPKGVLVGLPHNWELRQFWALLWRNGAISFQRLHRESF